MSRVTEIAAIAKDRKISIARAKIIYDNPALSSEEIDKRVESERASLFITAEQSMLIDQQNKEEKILRLRPVVDSIVSIIEKQISRLLSSDANIEATIEYVTKTYRDDGGEPYGYSSHSTFDAASPYFRYYINTTIDHIVVFSVEIHEKQNNIDCLKRLYPYDKSMLDSLIQRMREEIERQKSDIQ